MRKYEVVFVFSPEEEHYKSGLELVKKEFSRVGMEILKEEDLGTKSLAYPIANEVTGHYYCFNVDAEPNSIADLERPFKLAKEILKHLFVRSGS